MIKKGIVNKYFKKRTKKTLKTAIGIMLLFILMFAAITINMLAVKSEENMYYKRYGNYDLKQENNMLTYQENKDYDYVDKYYTMQLHSQQNIMNSNNSQIFNVSIIGMNENDTHVFGSDFIKAGRFPTGEKEALFNVNSREFNENYPLNKEKDIIGQTILVRKNSNKNWESYTITGTYDGINMNDSLIVNDNKKASEVITLYKFKKFNTGFIKFFEDGNGGIWTVNNPIYDNICINIMKLNISIDNNSIGKIIFHIFYYLHKYVYSMHSIVVMLSMVICCVVILTNFNNCKDIIRKCKIYGYNLDEIKTSIITKINGIICGAMLCGGIIGILCGRVLFEKLYYKIYEDCMDKNSYPILSLVIMTLSILILSIVYCNTRIKKYKKVPYTHIKDIICNKKRIKIITSVISIIVLLITNFVCSALLWNNMYEGNIYYQNTNNDMFFCNISMGNKNIEKSIDEYVNKHGGNTCVSSYVDCKFANKDLYEEYINGTASNDSANAWELQEFKELESEKIINSQLLVYSEELFKDLKLEDIKEPKDNEAIILSSKLSTENYYYYYIDKLKKDMGICILNEREDIVTELNILESYSGIRMFSEITIVVNQKVYDNYIEKMQDTIISSYDIMNIKGINNMQEYNLINTFANDTVSFYKNIKDDKIIEPYYCIMNMDELTLVIVSILLVIIMNNIGNIQYKYDGNKKTIYIWFAKQFMESVLYIIITAFVSLLIMKVSTMIEINDIINLTVIKITLLFEMVITLFIILCRLIKFIKSKKGNIPVINNKKYIIPTALVASFLSIYVINEVTSNSKVNNIKADIEFFEEKLDDSNMYNIKKELIKETNISENWEYFTEMDIDKDKDYGELFILKIDANVHISKNIRNYRKLMYSVDNNEFLFAMKYNYNLEDLLEKSIVTNKNIESPIMLYGCTYGKSKEEIIESLNDLKMDLELYIYDEVQTIERCTLDLEKVDIKNVENIYNKPEGL